MGGALRIGLIPRPVPQFQRSFDPLFLCSYVPMFHSDLRSIWLNMV